jgi:Zn-dependent M16 (insulinase) family peptidase
MTKFIIGTISGIDRPNTPATRGNLALIRKIAGIDAERLNKTRAEILSCTPEAVHKYADLFRKIYKNNVIIAVGNDKEIKKNAELFSTVRTLV